MIVFVKVCELIEEGVKKVFFDLKVVVLYDFGKLCEVKVEYKSMIVVC